MRSLLNRDVFGDWLNSHHIVGVGVEVGTYRGDYANLIRSTWKGAVLHTCDPWAHYDGYVDGCVRDYNKNREPLDLESYKKEAEDKLSKFGTSAVVHRTTGTNLLKEFSDGALDWVYLDGAHDYGTVMAEFELAWKKISRGGVVGGHDLYTRDDAEQKCGVWDVVWSKARELNLQPHVTHCTSWWFQKP